MSEQERERILHKEDEEPESDVEGHLKSRSEGEPTSGEAGIRSKDDPDVEGHMKP